MSNNGEIFIGTIPESEEYSLFSKEKKEKFLGICEESITIEVKDAEKYKGVYEVTPLARQSQELETKDKVLEKNIKVLEVPYFETSNQDGTTIYIAKGDN